MTRHVYTNESQVRLKDRLSPIAILRNLAKHKELLFAFTHRDFQATYKGTYLGFAWTIISPLIMLAVFTLVFGYIFRGRFNLEVEESPMDYALALFVGLGFFNLISMTMGTSATLMSANSTYVKGGAFPLEIIPVSSVLVMIISLGISLGLCTAAFFSIHGYLHVTMLGLIPLILSTVFLALALSWFISALGVFIRDLASIIPPISLVLMFASSVFFPIDLLPNAMQPLVRVNPLATIIDEARASLLYGQWVDPLATSIVMLVSLTLAILSYGFFVRTKHAFADVL